MHAKAKAQLREMYMAPTKQEALKAYEHFLNLFGAKYDRACECLRKDKEVLFTYYDFPAEHWVHIRTTNPIESTFGTVRHRTRKTKGCGSRIATLTMVFKLSLEAQKTWKSRGTPFTFLYLQFFQKSCKRPSFFLNDCTPLLDCNTHRRNCYP